jgi:KDO2-lipid IV(A) lauroyltransferase
MKKLRHLAEYAALRLFLFLIDHLPLRASEGIACALADLWFAADTRRRNITCDNIRRSGITDDETNVRRIAKDSFRHFGCVVIDSLKSDRYFSPESWRERIELDVAPDTLNLINKPGQGLMLISGHLGNWEIAAQVISYLKPVVGITRDMNNPYVDALMKKRKPRNNFTLTPKHDADMGRLLTALKEGRVLALLIDQHARTRGMMVDFFGTPASTHTSHALLHLITKIPICFGYCVKTGPMQFKFKALPPITVERTGNRDADVRAILERLTHELENAIRAYPEQYLWAHRRWRQVP